MTRVEPTAVPIATSLSVKLSPQGRIRRSAALLCGVGLGALASTWPAQVLAEAAPGFGSSAWFAAQQGTASGKQGGAAATGSLGANLGRAVTTPSQALQRADRSITDLSRATAAIDAARQAQSAAHQLALGSAGDVPDGLVEGGLMVSSQAAADAADPSSCAAGYTCSWLNADLPEQTVEDGRTVVTVEQSDRKAILTWESFNVGQNTTLHIDQSAGTQSDGSNDWVALNRVMGAGAAPSRILGQIQAEGTVYLINQNGILFEGSSQVNVHSLIASTLPIYLPSGAQTLTPGNDAEYLAYSNQQFLENGITSVGSGTAAGNILGIGSGNTIRQSQLSGLPGDISIAAGATITTGAEGFSLIAAPTVTNEGWIQASDGQAILAAGYGVSLRNPASGTALLDPVVTGSIIDDANGNADVTPRSSVVNRGLIESARGNISLLGLSVDQSGVLLATTSVSQAGSITLIAEDEAATDSQVRRTGLVRFGRDSVTALLPDDSEETTTSSSAANAAFQTGTIKVRGAAVTLERNALIEAPGQNVSITAVAANDRTVRSGLVDGSITGRVYLDDTAIIDVAGLANVEHAMSDNLVTVGRVGANELADSPLQRVGVLFGAQITIDRRETGTDANGNAWVGTDIANVQGYIDAVPQSVQDLLADGGSIALTGGQVITRTGSLLNLDGGYKTYLGGMIQTTRLIAANGAIIDIADADPNQTYIGIAGVHVRNSSRWNQSASYLNPIIGTAGYYESSYIEGGNAGSLSIYGSEATVLNGTISANAFAGRHQVADSDLPDGGSFYAGAGSGGSAITSLYPDLSSAGAGPSYVIVDEVRQLSDDFSADSDLIVDEAAEGTLDDPYAWTELSGQQLESAGFAHVAIVADDPTLISSTNRPPQGGEILVSGQGLTVAEGGSITLTGARVRIEGNLKAVAGSIQVTGTGNTAVAGSTTAAAATGGESVAGDITVAAGVEVSAAGQWVNDTGRDEDQITGGTWADGGEIVLQTLQNSAEAVDTSGCEDPSHCYLDTTGSVKLQQGSVLDVSSGGRVDTSGALVQSDGIIQGQAGSVSLLTYVANGDEDTVYGSQFLQLPDHRPNSGRIVMNGDIRGYGFSGGGTLSLRALGIVIADEADSELPVGTLQLGSDFFNQGFGAYRLSSVFDADVADGTTVTITQTNYLGRRDQLLGLATGTSLSDSGAVQLGQLDPYHRQATDFSLYAGDYLNWRTVAGEVPRYGGADISGTLRVGEGSSLLADAGAGITLGSTNVLAVYGQIVAHGGSITLTGDTANGGYAQIPGAVSGDGGYASGSDAIWLGVHARLDVSGVALIDPWAEVASVDGATRTPRAGRVLDGGTITLTNDTGYIIALNCRDTGGCPDGYTAATLDASGTSTRLDVRSDSASGYTRQQVWSDAGTIRIGAGAGLYFDGELRAQGGAAEAAGGTLSITPLNGLGPTSSGFRGAERLVLRNHPIDLPAGALSPGEVVEADSDFPSGVLYFAADRLEGSGIETLNLGVDPALHDAAPTVVSLGHDLDLRVARALTINASVINGIDSEAQPSSSIHLSAEYVSLHGYGPGAQYSALPELDKPNADVRLTVNAGSIDIGGQLALRNIGTARFNSDGDIRFVTPAAYSYYVDSTGSLTRVAGVLYTSGDLSFRADQLYPATDNEFIIAAVGAKNPDGTRADTTIRFLANKGANKIETPLSAGGSLLVDAAHIIQSGVLRAPGGSIVLGVSDPQSEADQTLFRYLVQRNQTAEYAQLSLTRTETVRLTGGSLTSVSLDGMTVPYGTTVDGENWRYDGSAQTDNPASNIGDLNAPPDKFVSVNGNSLSIAGGARVDLSGGGSLQAQEWVAGTGGSQDVLSQYNTVYTSGGVATQQALYADGRAVYAIIPGYDATLAAYDPALVAGDPLIGQAVYLSGIPGLKPGVYTLLPGQYATLPGAYRVVQDTSASNTRASQNTTLADGSYYISGYFTDTLTGAHDATSTAFVVQSSDVWGQYSEYTLSSADTYFTQRASEAGVVAPRLAADAGQLVLAATRKLRLKGDIDTEAAENGAAAIIDIAANQIEIVGSDAQLPSQSSYVALNAEDLSKLGAGSLLIGGTRSNTDEGMRVNAVASDVVVNTQGEVLSAPDLILVSTATGSGIQVLDGSRIEASGEASAVAPILIGSLPVYNRNGKLIQEGVSGDGALLRVSASDDTLVQRVNVPGVDVEGAALGLLRIESGSSLAGSGSILLDATGDTRIGGTAKFDAPIVDLVSSSIQLGGTDPGQGLRVSSELLEQFAQAESLILRSRTDIQFVGNQSLAFDGSLTLSAGNISGDAGQVSISAGSLQLDNALNATTATMEGSAALSVDAGSVVFGAGTLGINGFETVDIAATESIRFEGEGGTDFGVANVTLSSPYLLAESGARNGLKTTGTLSASANGSADLSTVDSLGGSLDLTAGSLYIDTLLTAPAGTLSLQAIDGDLTLGATAVLSVAGEAREFYDVTEYAAGGNLILDAAEDLQLASGAVLDFSAAEQGGDAGTLSLTAGGDAVLDASLQGDAAEGNLGGSYMLDIGGAVDLDRLAAALNSAGVDQSIDIHTRSGALTLSETSTLHAASIRLTSDGDADADSGWVNVLGSIDASGLAGGTISLYGRQGVDVQGSLVATASGARQRGGQITLATTGETDGSYNATYGYQNVRREDSGVIRIGSDAVLNVQGGHSGGLSGGLVSLRAPLLADGDVAIDVDSDARIQGAREVSLEAYARWSADDATSGAQHFDGIVDPAGLYTADGTVAQEINAAHTEFYQNTLMQFVQSPGFVFEQRLANIDGLVVRPGIDLVQPDGDIQVLSNWNLGSGQRDAQTGLLRLDYRYLSSIAPVLSLRAAGDIHFLASLSDGFYQVNNPLSSNSAYVDNTAAPVANSDNPMPLASATLMGATTDADGKVVAADSTSYRIVAGADLDSAAPTATGLASGTITLEGHSETTITGDDRILVAPVMIRTGTGFIDLAASGNLELQDTVAPGVIYTAGRAVDPSQAGQVSQLVITVKGAPLYLDTGDAQSEAAGDIRIEAGGDIIGVQQIVDADGLLTGRTGQEVSQYWWPWLIDSCRLTRDGCDTEDRSSSSVNFGAFRQGVLSLGGSVQVSAGGDIRDFSVSLPTTWSIVDGAIQTVGGGDLNLSVRGDLLSGAYLVSSGSGRIRVGGAIAADVQNVAGESVATLLALNSGQLDLSAIDSIEIGGVYNPSYLFTGSDSQAYGEASSVSLTSTGGDLRFNTASAAALDNADGQLVAAYDYILPANLSLVSMQGKVSVERRGELFPSPYGQLEIIAAGDIRFWDAGASGTTYFGLIDANPNDMPTALNPIGTTSLRTSWINSGADSAYADHDPDLLHRHDDQPLRIYSLNGDIINGDQDLRNALVLASAKPAQIRAGRDIVNLSFRGQNLYASDVTLIQAGRDLYDTPLLAQESVPVIEVGGPGTLVLEAGRDIGPLTSANEALARGYLRTGSTASYPGIRTVGNDDNAYLSRTGANISVVFGIAQGLDLQAFAAAYFAPGVSVDGIGSYDDELIAFMEQIQRDAHSRTGTAVSGPLSADEAWAAYQLLPEIQQRQFAYSVFFDVLDHTGIDYNNPDSLYYQQYARGYQAISTLFPASLGYTQNSLDGGENGAEDQVVTGNLDMRGSTIQTVWGGDISLLGPGGDVLIGSVSAPPYVPQTSQSRGIGPNDQGVLTLRGGDINTFADGSVLLAQSRIFTESGGDILIWSSNGDINAGKGAKTTTEVAQREYVCDPDHYCIVDAAAAVSGAGIAVLQPNPDEEAGNANLVAPRGTVDAGDAGIRVAGNLNVAALQVANVDNIQVQGNQAGVPTGLTDTSALSVANSVAAAVQQSAEELSAPRGQDNAASLLTVEVLGFGGSSDDL